MVAPLHFLFLPCQTDGHSAPQRSADGVRADTEQTLAELRLSVERLQELLEELLERSVLEKLQQSQEVREQLEDEVQQRRKRDEHMTDLISCQDHIYFLQVCHRFLLTCGHSGSRQ